MSLYLISEYIHCCVYTFYFSLASPSTDELMVEVLFVHLIISFINPAGFILKRASHKRVMWNTWWWVCVAAVCKGLIQGSFLWGPLPSTLGRNFLWKHFCLVWKTTSEAYPKHTDYYTREVDTPLPPHQAEDLIPQMSLFISSATKLGPMMAQLGDLFQNDINSKPALPCSPRGPQSSEQWGGVSRQLLSLSLFLVTPPPKLTALFWMFNRWDWEQSFLLMLCYKSM